MTENNTLDTLDLANVDFSTMSQSEILDFMQAKIASVKAGAEQEKERLRAEYKASLQTAAEHAVAHGTQAETALWSGYRMRGEVVVVAGEAYNANLTLTHIKRKAELVAAKATAGVVAPTEDDATPSE
jgi:ABC-type hemin transport system substrate-binding protein